MKFSLLVFLVSVIAGLACAQGADGDELVSRTTSRQQQNCEGPGYCWGQTSNPISGKSEYKYGYRSSCAGKQCVQVATSVYQRPDGSTYTLDNQTGTCGDCEVN